MDEITDKIIDFIRSVGIEVTIVTFEGETVLPGIAISNGGLLVDTEKLLYPGDLLHEAGHLAVVPPEIRRSMNGALDPKEDFKLAGEQMAIPWSYAAAIHIGIDPAIVFHSDGYKGESEWLLGMFKNNTIIGLPALQWIGLTISDDFPKMIKWLRE
jgi:hypothetical protein